MKRFIVLFLAGRSCSMTISFAQGEKFNNNKSLLTAFSFSRYLTVSISPSYYIYQSQFSWQDEENPNNFLEHNYQHEQVLHYLSLPLLVRFSPAAKRLRPYIQAGEYYNCLLSAQKQVRTEGIDQASGGQVSFKETPQSIAISHLYIQF